MFLRDNIIFKIYIFNINKRDAEQHERFDYITVRTFLTLLHLAFLVFCAAGNRNGVDAAEQDLNWWKTSVIYQIYPRSFKDSNGDGIGDLNGIMSKLEHIKDTGAHALRLSPIFSSPQKDFGYDISNFIDISPEFSTLEDFAKLVQKAKSLGLKVLLDFVYLTTLRTSMNGSKKALTA